MRNIRPSYVSVSVDGATRTATGPRSRSGELSVEFSARADGSAAPFLSVDAIASADGASVLWRVTDRRTGRVILEERVSQ